MSNHKTIIQNFLCFHPHNCLYLSSLHFIQLFAFMASFNKVYHAMPLHGNRLCPIMQWSTRSASCAFSNDAVCSYDAAVSGPSVSAARSSHCCESQVCSQPNSAGCLNNNEPFFSNLIEIESQQPS